VPGCRHHARISAVRDPRATRAFDERQRCLIFARFGVELGQPLAPQGFRHFSIPRANRRSRQRQLHGHQLPKHGDVHLHGRRPLAARLGCRRGRTPWNVLESAAGHRSPRRRHDVTRRGGKPVGARRRSKRPRRSRPRRFLSAQHGVASPSLGRPTRRRAIRRGRSLRSVRGERGRRRGRRR
jgi:hypothetical protein